VVIHGDKALTLRGDRIADDFQQLVQNYIDRRFGQTDKA